MESVLEIRYALDTFYFLVSGMLVMWMAAGFSMLEAGMVRSMNTVEILTKNIALYSIACIMYMLIGYNIMYGDGGSVLPGLGFLVQGDNSVQSVLAGGEQAPYYSSMADFFFQVVFVATAMSVVSGAVAERMKLWAFLLFSVVMTGVLYPVHGYWTWGGGFLDQLGFSDYAGSGIVHMAGAAAALAGVLILGPRRGKYGPGGKISPIPGSNLPLSALGTFILWMGWFGFNGGSELKVSDVESANAVAMVFANTNMAAASGMIVALTVSQLSFGKADLTMGLNGALAGLVAITAEPSAPSMILASGIGAVGGIIVVLSIVALDKMGIDDPVGAISVHGVCGVWGLLAVLFSSPEASLAGQVVGIAVIFAWMFGTSLALWLGLKAVIGIRISEEVEYSGMDSSECGMEAYPEFMGAKGGE
ncbi:ammonium transporter [Desulfovermiculus halophilus]|uniref:ammonium transporter n=1 Tax=Desulfovermiculus halophilus TaxID=339722 RepID=UPI000488A2FA|nr:ammonium transporter [Desulfovermiculus halophilus]